MNCNRTTRWLLFALLMIAFSAASHAQIAVGISVRVGPPALPVYEQPLCPGPGYLWTPGYWAWNDDDGYYWVPGTWVVAPVGMLWTPGYWGWNEGVYAWHAGYWGPHIGFYGGVNYGFGYGGVGFVGGEWRGGAFFYNSAVMHVDSTHITNVYVNKTVIVNNTNVSRVSYNGGEGGISARATREEERAEHEHHQAALPEQEKHEHAAAQNRQNFASANHGRPAIAATAKPGEFKGKGVVQAKAAGAPYHPPKMSPKEARATAPGNHPSKAANTNNASKPANHASQNSSPKAQAKSNGGNNAQANKGRSPFSRPANAKNSANSRNSNSPKLNASAQASRPAPQHVAAHPAPQEHASRPAPQHAASHPAPQEHTSRPAPAPRHDSAPQKSAPKSEHKGR